MPQHKQGKDHKKWKYGKKQIHGNSRAAYFASRQLWRAAANKARRIKAAEAQRQRAAEKRRRRLRPISDFSATEG